MTLVLDAGVLIALDRRDRRIGALLRVAQRDEIAVTTSAAVVAQVWRSGSRQANLARVLAGVDVASLDGPTARRVGEVSARSGTPDVVDAHLALLVGNDDTVLTADPGDLRRILDARSVSATIRTI
ncbi:MAG TPA: hypothetical protein VKG43_11600 [Acidimicrobiales bacterium]|nr:hypothetical protein [Acidimicrobiales bacterium]